MGLFDRSGRYRLEDRRPEKQRKRRVIKSRKPPKALSGLSCILLLALAGALLCYGAEVLMMRTLGVETEAEPNTRLDASGAVKKTDIQAVSSTMHLTFRDRDGILHECSLSLLGNQAQIGETVNIRYFPYHPQWVMLSSRTAHWTVPAGSAFLGFFLVRVCFRRLREIRNQKNTEKPLHRESYDPADTT